MDWNKIDIETIMKILREAERINPRLDGKYSMTYEDGDEELTITYRRKDGN